MPGLLLVGILLILAAIVLAALVAGRATRQQRTREMRVLASSLGYEYHEKQTGLTQALGQFTHLSQDGFYSHTATNLLISRVDDIAVTVFDDSWTTGQGPQQRTHTQTVLLLASERLDLPEFVLRPAGPCPKIRGVMGRQAIDFEDHPTFSAAYVLQGPDEAQIRALFSGGKRTFFAECVSSLNRGPGARIIIIENEPTLSVAGTMRQEAKWYRRPGDDQGGGSREDPAGILSGCDEHSRGCPHVAS